MNIVPDAIKTSMFSLIDKSGKTCEYIGKFGNLGGHFKEKSENHGEIQMLDKNPWGLQG